MKFGTPPRQLFATFCNPNDLHPSRNSPAEAARCQRASCQRLTHLRKFQKKKKNPIHSASARLRIHTARIFLPWAEPQMIEFCWHLAKIEDVFVESCSATGNSSTRAHFTARKCSESCCGFKYMFIKAYKISL